MIFLYSAPPVFVVWGVGSFFSCARVVLLGRLVYLNECPCVLFLCCALFALRGLFCILCGEYVNGERRKNLETVFTACQFTVKPNSCIVQVAHLGTKESMRRKGYGTAALAAMLLGGCHLNQALFGAATNRMEVTDGTYEVCACNSL